MKRIDSIILLVIALLLVGLFYLPLALCADKTLSVFIDSKTGKVLVSDAVHVGIKPDGKAIYMVFGKGTKKIKDLPEVVEDWPTLINYITPVYVQDGEGVTTMTYQAWVDDGKPKAIRIGKPMQIFTTANPDIRFVVGDEVDKPINTEAESK